MPPVPDEQRKLSGEHLFADLLSWSRTMGGRMVRGFRRLPHEGRLAALASIGLLLVLFLPWYQETVVVPGAGAASEASASVTGWGHFSFVEAAVLLVGAGVLTLLFQRAEGRAFHLPGGDGFVIMVGGGWSCLLMIWQIFDKPSASIHGPGTAISGVEWGIFAALAVSGVLTYAGSRIRRAHRPEPPLPGDVRPPASAGILLAKPDGAEEIRAHEVAREREAVSGEEDPTVVKGSTADASPTPARAPTRHSASSRPRGWLTTPARRGDPGSDSEQLTIPIDAEE